MKNVFVGAILCDCPNYVCRHRERGTSVAIQLLSLRTERSGVWQSTGLKLKFYRLLRRTRGTP